MKIGINSDFLSGTHTPEYYLKYIADAGFTHVHWCHQWNTDFIYSAPEIAYYKKVLRSLNLSLQDIHASIGKEKLIYSLEEYRRLAGVELLRNRIEMFAELEGSGALALHIPCYRMAYGFPQSEIDMIPRYMKQLRRTFEDLMPDLEKYNCALALENMPNELFECIGELMDAFPAERVGIAYDSGHGNYGFCQGLDCLEKWKHRLKVLHLHDNDGTLDRHQPPFYGTVDWERLVKLIAGSSYGDNPLSFELSMRHTPFFEPEKEKNQDDENIRKFMADAYERCCRVSEMYQAAKLS